MSAMISRTFSYLTSSLPTSNSGPKWTVPDKAGGGGGPCSHLPSGLASFLNSLYQAETAQDERGLVHSHLRAVEDRLLSEANPRPSLIADALVRAMAAHTLGYRAETKFAHIYAVQLAQKGGVLEKKMGYLACALFLEAEGDELVLLLVNTIVKDLGSKNVIEVNIALTAAVELTPAEMAPMLIPILIEKTTHTKDFIRKKSLICIQRLVTKNLDLGPQVEIRVRQCLSDPDPGVVAVAVQVLRTLLLCRRSNSCRSGGGDRLKDMVPSLIKIQLQILEGKLPTEYNHRAMPAPWFQMDLVALVAMLIEKSGEEWDQTIYKDVTDMLIRTMNQANPKETVGQAVIFECISAIASMNGKESAPAGDGVASSSSGDVLCSKAFQHINRFLQSKHNNSKYMGLEGLELVLKHAPPDLTNAQEENVLECLSHQDDSIKRKTLSLLYVLANKDNVKMICAKLIEHMRGGDPFQKENLIGKALELANRYGRREEGGGRLDWYVTTMLQLLREEEKDNYISN